MIILFTSSGLLAQSNISPITLFEYNMGKQTNEVLPEHETERYYIAFDTNIADEKLLEPGNQIEFPINGEVLTLSVLRVSEYMPETFSVIAGNDNGALLAFTIADDRVFGKLHHVEINEMYHFDYDVIEGSNYLAKIAPTNLDILDCTIDDLHVHKDGQLHGDTEEFIARHKSAHSPSVSAMTASLDDEITIDLMIVYTPAAVDWSVSSQFGSMGAVIAQSMNLSQGALDNSDIGIELRLVHTHLTAYDELNDNADSNARLRRLTSSPSYRPASWETDWGYMDEVHTLRDQFGADLVAGFFNVSDTGGLAWVLGNTGGSPLIGFSLNRVQQIATGYTLIHEIGHNMGNLHARNQNSQAAGIVGGLFHYSAGYRWANQIGDSLHTVMAYSQGAQQAPLFSSPDLSFSGTPAGTYAAGVGPTDNRRSMREIKRSMANYRPTEVDAPEKTVSSDMVTVTMNREDYTEVSLSINNDGASNLMWYVDFDFPTQPVLPKMKASSDIESIDFEESIAPEFPSGATELAASDHDGTIFSENFSTFSTGSTTAQNEWRSGNNSTTFEVSGSNPSSGSNHIRLRSNAIDSNTLRVRSPYFGPQAFGEFELSMDIAIFPDGLTQQVERHDIYVYDGATGSISSGLVFADNLIYAWGFNNEGGTSFLNTTFPYTLSEYKNLRIVYNSSDGVIEYFYDNQKIADRPYTLGTTIDYFHVLNFNATELGFIDIDNITVKRPHIFPWLEVEKYAGSTEPSGSDNLILQFDTQGVEAGTYEVDMYVYSNDPDQEFKIIPIQLNVNNEVSTETGDERPDGISLSQNYPNPFNPGTMIRYQLPATSNVQLDVFDVLGRKVATLENGLVQAGTHEVYFDASGFSSGIYIYRLNTGQQVLTRQMVLVK
jgi:hypothetical protein